jgi:predicted DNA-binding transcriptional regulator AlpA
MEYELLKPKAVAKMLGMSVPWVYKAAKRRILPCVEYPGMGENGSEPVRFKKEDVIQFVEKHYRKRTS